MSGVVVSPGGHNVHLHYGSGGAVTGWVKSVFSPYVGGVGAGRNVPVILLFAAVVLAQVVLCHAARRCRPGGLALRTLVSRLRPCEVGTGPWWRWVSELPEKDPSMVVRAAPATTLLLWYRSELTTTPLYWASWSAPDRPSQPAADALLPSWMGCNARSHPGGVSLTSARWLSYSNCKQAGRAVYRPC